jgi:hypothetical protein
VEETSRALERNGPERPFASGDRTAHRQIG